MSTRLSCIVVTAIVLLAVGGSGAGGQPPADEQGPQTDRTGTRYFTSLYDANVPPGILDGVPKTFVVIGYSTSQTPDSKNNWPAVLQRMLDQHAGDRRIYHIYNQAKGSTPIEPDTHST
jgi:hypothetical protein